MKLLLFFLIQTAAAANEMSDRLTKSFDTLSIGKQHMRVRPDGTYYSREKAKVEIKNDKIIVDEHAKSQKRGGQPR